ncbi:hypothetical protein Ate02nite_49560 [Paractinoplanes tereljensis]|uniref:DUF4365 domain-containing protein n=2 Tax=Paractinoplanes tereljensis TaxID=571912 RepID=A0A919NQI2_9ACTN|nr:hypothetical protein Ate02nite_49560 [Actinoplanes tereljensis]
MPTRKIQHKNGDRAVTAVRRIWEEAGAAVDEIKHDYGEDLLVQTCLGDIMDASRIWVQVKGVQRTGQSFRNGRGSRNVRIKPGHLGRWIRGVDLVVVVLWDIDNQMGWFTEIPSMEFQVELARHGVWSVDAQARAELPFPIAANNRFDVAVAHRLSWHARLDNYATHVRVLESLVSHIERNNELADLSRQIIEVEPYKLTSIYLAVNAMLDLGILEKSPGSPAAVSSAFQERLETDLADCLEIPMPDVLPEGSTPQALRHFRAIGMACIRQAQEKSGTALDGAMAIQFGNIVHGLLLDESSGLCDVCDCVSEAEIA